MYTSGVLRGALRLYIKKKKEKKRVGSEMEGSVSALENE